MKIQHFFRLAFIFFFIQLLIPATSIAYAVSSGNPEMVGHVIWIKGTLTGALPNASPRTLKRQSEIFEHDTLTTGAESEGKLSFKNNNVLVLHANSTIKIDQYWPTDEKATSGFFKKLMQAIRSGLRAITGKFTDSAPGGIAPVTVK